MYVALPKSHPLARKRGLKLEELADENWILGTTGSCPDASIFLRSCQVAGFEPRIAFNSDDYFAMQGFVAAGVGASFIPDLALMSVREDIVVRSLGPRPPVRQIMAAHAEGLLPVAGQAGDARRPRRGRRGVRRQASRPRAGLVAFSLAIARTGHAGPAWPTTPTSSAAPSTPSRAATCRRCSRSPTRTSSSCPPPPAWPAAASPTAATRGCAPTSPTSPACGRSCAPSPPSSSRSSDVVVCTGRVYAWGVGRVIDAPAGWVWRLRDGKLVEGRVYENQREALAAAGLA